MNDYFRTVLKGIAGILINNDFDNTPDKQQMPLQMSCAFLTALAADEKDVQSKAVEFLSGFKKSQEYGSAAQFYLDGIDLIRREIDHTLKNNEGFYNALKALSEMIEGGSCDLNELSSAESIWKIFFPEGCGIQADKDKAVDSLRNRRRIRITEANNSPITDPAGEIIFTSNVLLTVPSADSDLSEIEVGDNVKSELEKVIMEEQKYWYDHPIPLGIKNENNEFLYGLHGLDSALEFEKERGNIKGNKKNVCLLSVSVTHKGLHEIAKPYLADVLKSTTALKNIDVYIFTETDAEKIIEEIIIPAAAHFLNRDTAGLKDIFGVDGEYGRHYSFLKAIAFFWNVLIDDTVKATFKIDLDQVFPQDELVSETGKSALEHFKTPLWGAKGFDHSGTPVELGMIAGALVNDRDIGRGLFTPDVAFPEKPPQNDELVFYSPLPQALSTEAEMMTRYNAGEAIDGENQCIERIHVTGGTNGILVDYLKKYRPFTPSFIGRAEDQAYILSTLFNSGERLVYLHRDGLVMRHDKESFAQEAIKSAHVSKLVGDYIRILYFSAYGRVVSDDLSRVKDLVDPFTGCFISYIPLTVVYLRFALKVISMIKQGKFNDAAEFLCSGSRRISGAVEFSAGKESMLKKQYEKEKRAWKLFYDTVSVIEDGLNCKNGFALDLKKKAEIIVTDCHLKNSFNG